jgi:hypothetical protein
MTRNKILRVTLVLSILAVMLAVQVPWQNVSAQDIVEECAAPSWTGQMFANADFNGAPAHILCRRIIHFDWGGGMPMSGVGPDNFSTRWNTTYTFPTAGNYLFTVGVAGGVRLTVNNQVLIDSMENLPGFRSLSAEYAIAEAGKPVTLMIEGAHWTGQDKALHFNWFLTQGGSPGAMEDHSQIFSSGPNAFAVDGGNVWNIEHWQATSIVGEPIALDIHVADGISYDYEHRAPAAGMDEDVWTSRWTRIVDFPTGSYTFTLRVEDQAYVYIDGQEIIFHPTRVPETTSTATLDLTAGRHTIQVLHTDVVGDEWIFFTWDPPVGTMLWPDGCNGIFTHGIAANAPLCSSRGPAVIP